MIHVGLKDRMHFTNHVLNPLLTSGILEFTQPDSSHSPTQKYRLTAKGEKMREQLEKDGGIL